MSEAYPLTARSRINLVTLASAPDATGRCGMILRKWYLPGTHIIIHWQIGEIENDGLNALFLDIFPALYNLSWLFFFIVNSMME